MVGVIPPRAGSFQDRSERERLRAAATGDGTVVPCQVLVGMGGVGKTQLAADYAERAWDDGHGVDLLVWVTASSQDAVVAGFARAAAKVCGTDMSEPLEAAREFLVWLRSGGRRWLVVLDDLVDPDDLSGLWPPAVAHGQTVLTTRRRDAALVSGSGRRRIEVGLFTTAEAVAYLLSVLAAAERTETPGELAGLAGDLGRLPLALSQAAAYILDSGIGAGEYRELLAHRARSLAEISPDVRPDDQVHTMAAAWELSVDYADRLRPAGLARPMLQLTAFLAPHATPVLALTSSPALNYLTAHRTPAPQADPAGPNEPVTLQDAAGVLRALHRLSLITAPGPPSVHTGRDAAAVAWDGRVVRVHQIVQRATRDTLTPDHYQDSARSAGDALLAVWPDIERDTDLSQALRACATALISCTREGAQHTDCLYQPDPHEILNQLGSSLGESGQVSAAAHHYAQLAEEARRHVGPDHPDTLAVRHSLARWRGEAGDVAGAVTAFTELLNDVLRVFGPDHPHTLVTRHSLARWRGQAGDAADAATATSELLADRLRVLGPDHPATLRGR